MDFPKELTCMVSSKALRGSRIPAFKVHEDTLVKSMPQAVALLPILLQLSLEAEQRMTAK